LEVLIDYEEFNSSARLSGHWRIIGNWESYGAAPGSKWLPGVCRRAKE